MERIYLRRGDVCVGPRSSRMHRPCPWGNEGGSRVQVVLPLKAGASPEGWGVASEPRVMEWGPGLGFPEAPWLEASV